MAIKIKAVLFDLGETLLNFGKVKTFALFGKGAKLSYDYLKNCDQRAGTFISYCLRSLFSLRLNNALSNITGSDFDSLALLKKVGTKKGIQLDEQQWQEFAWLWYEPLGKICQAESDIVETFAKLKNMDLKLGILSNTFVNGGILERHLGQLGLLDFLQTRIYSYQFNFRKPDPRIFIAAADIIGERLPNILYVGDRVNKDITPALNLDMHAALKNAYTNAGKNLPKGAWRITRISELPGRIEKNNANCE